MAYLPCSNSGNCYESWSPLPIQETHKKEDGLRAKGACQHRSKSVFPFEWK